VAAENLINALDIASGSAQSVILWSRMAMIEAMNQTFIARFLGEGPQALFQRVMDLSRERGDEVRYDLLIQLANAGVVGNTVLKGAEQTLTYQQQGVKVNQLRQGLGNYTLSQQRTIHDLRSDSLRNLTDWAARWIDAAAATWLSGFESATVGGFTNFGGVGNVFQGFFGGAVTAQDTDHTVDGSAGAFTPALIDRAIHKAKTLTPPIQPVRVDGDDWYVMFLHPRAAHSLRRDTEWTQAQRDANIRGRDNPIYTGAFGSWNGALLHEWNFLPTDAAATPDKNYSVLCGRQSLVIAFGNAIPSLNQVAAQSDTPNGVPFYWGEELDDYGARFGVSLSAIFGMIRTIFNAKSFASIAVTSGENPIT
jgi:N4-gp56 family major capsid protein